MALHCFVKVIVKLTEYKLLIIVTNDKHFFEIIDAYTVESETNPREPHDLKCLLTLVLHVAPSACIISRTKFVRTLSIVESCFFLKTFVTDVEKNLASLIDLVNSRQPTEVRQKVTSATQKGYGTIMEIQKYLSRS